MGVRASLPAPIRINMSNYVIRKSGYLWSQRRRLKTDRKLRTVHYRGFNIETYKDRDRHIPISGVIVPISPRAKRMTFGPTTLSFGCRERPLDKILDYTGWRNKFEAVYDKKDQIDRILTPVMRRYQYFILR